jgi:SAM-dependent methyltransferase
MASVPYQLWAEYVGRLAGLAGRAIVPGSKVLDLATGTGSVALEFAARGCVVTGIDCSEPMLAQARRKASERGLTVRLLCRDVSDFELAAEFDLAVCLYDSLNYILDSTALQRAFANVRSSLKSDGVFIFDVNTVKALEGELFTQRSGPGAPLQYDWRSKYDPSARISRIRMTFQAPGMRKSIKVVHRQRAYTDTELRSLLEAARFEKVRSYEAYQTSPPVAESDRVFYVAHTATPRVR